MNTVQPITKELKDSSKIAEFEHEGKKYTLTVPTAGDIREANFIYNKRFTEAINSGIYTRNKLEKELESQDSDFFKDITASRTEILDEIKNTEELLENDELQSKPEELESLSTILAIYRNQLIQVEETVNNLYANTAEEIATDDKRSFLLFRILKNEDGSRVYKEYQDYLNEYSNSFLEKAKFEFLCWEYNLDRNWRENLPENLAMEKASKLRKVESKKSTDKKKTVARKKTSSTKKKVSSKKKTFSKKTSSGKTRIRRKKTSKEKSDES